MDGGYRPGAAGDTRKGPSSRPTVDLAILLFVQVPPPVFANTLITRHL